MQAKVSQPVRYGVLALAAALAAGLLSLGVMRLQAERRAATLAGHPEAVSPSPGAGAQGAPRDDQTAARGAGQAPARVPAPASAPVEQPKPELLVHVTGAVLSPGVYKLQQGMRVADAIAAAGGALSGAMPDALNLAARLSDGDKLYVPTAQEAQETHAPATAPPAARGATQRPVTATAHSSAPAGVPQSSSGPAGPVNINTATAEELDRVNGIGPATAKAIVAYRTKKGSFRRLEDLAAVSGIGPKTLERLKPYLTL